MKQYLTNESINGSTFKCMFAEPHGLFRLCLSQHAVHIPVNIKSIRP